MAPLPQISEAEYEVMKVVWKYAPINTNEITEKLLKTTAWSPKTIQTLIKRLGGDITAMLSAYIENDGLSDTELEQLRFLLSKDNDK